MFSPLAASSQRPPVSASLPAPEEAPVAFELWELAEDQRDFGSAVCRRVSEEVDRFAVVGGVAGWPFPVLVFWALLVARYRCEVQKKCIVMLAETLNFFFFKPFGNRTFATRVSLQATLSLHHLHFSNTFG